MRFGDNANNSLKAVMEIRKTIVKTLTQTGKNKSQGYGFYSQLDLQPISDRLLELDCILLFSTSIEYIKAGYNKITNRDGREYDRLTTHCGCDAVLRCVSINDSNDWVEVNCYGFKTDMSSDKALGAATIAKRYGIMQMFDIPTIEADPDGDADVRLQNNNILRSQATRKQTLLPTGGKRLL